MKRSTANGSRSTIKIRSSCIRR